MNSYCVQEGFIVNRVLKALDQYFKEPINHSGPVLWSPNVLKLVKNKNNLAQVYHTQKAVLRFDHTHGSLNQELWCPVVSQGKVFRKGAKYKGRYRQFYQYDVDYPFEDYQTYPIIKLKRLFKSAPLLVNDLNLLKQFLHKDSLSEEDQALKKQIEAIDLKEYERQFYIKYPTLTDCVVSPTIIRGWDYYRSLVFEVSMGSSWGSLAGGGVYARNDKLYLGFSVGVSRIIGAKLLNQLNLMIPVPKIHLIVYKDSVPINLVEALDLHKIPYILKKKLSSLAYILKKANKKAHELNFILGRVLVIDPKEDKQKQYLSDSLRTKHSVTLDQLIEELK